MKAPATVTVYRTLEIREVHCDAGFTHAVPVYAEKHLYLTDEVRINETVGGYSDTERENPVYRDAEGRRWERYVSVDFSGNISYHGPDAALWESYPPRNGVRFDKATR